MAGLKLKPYLASVSLRYENPNRNLHVGRLRLRLETKVSGFGDDIYGRCSADRRGSQAAETAIERAPGRAV
jgi:hypothetical protein